jgi:palmitoyltransferase
MWLPPHGSLLGLGNHFLFLCFVGLSLYNFFCAMFIGPGHVPLKWRPAGLEEEEARKCLQYCHVCEGFKAPRAHHCRKCARCVLKMDHHCPWINNCCGHFNQAYFTLFLISAVVGAVQALILLVVAIYRGYHANWYYFNGDRNHLVFLTFTSFMFAVFSIGLCVGVIIAVGGLFVVQMKVILRNKTAIEDWIVVKAETRDREEDDLFVYPYNLGWTRNFKEVFLKKLGDGITWPVIEGCTQYNLTREQLEQKEEKRMRSRQYQVTCDYDGSWFPLMAHGLKTCIKFPLSDEPRVPLSRGDLINVTRWKKMWLYGEKVAPASTPVSERLRGWFPRKCVVEVIIPCPSSSSSPASHIIGGNHSVSGSPISRPHSNSAAFKKLN